MLFERWGNAVDAILGLCLGDAVSFVGRKESRCKLRDVFRRNVRNKLLDLVLEDV